MLGSAGNTLLPRRINQEEGVLGEDAGIPKPLHYLIQKAGVGGQGRLEGGDPFCPGPAFLGW